MKKTKGKKPTIYLIYWNTIYVGRMTPYGRVPGEAHIVIEVGDKTLGAMVHLDGKGAARAVDCDDMSLEFLHVKKPNLSGLPVYIRNQIDDSVWSPLSKSCPLGRKFFDTLEVGEKTHYIELENGWGGDDIDDELKSLGTNENYVKNELQKYFDKGTPAAWFNEKGVHYPK